MREVVCEDRAKLLTLRMDERLWSSGGGGGGGDGCEFEVERGCDHDLTVLLLPSFFGSLVGFQFPKLLMCPYAFNL